MSLRSCKTDYFFILLNLPGASRGFFRGKPGIFMTTHLKWPLGINPGMDRHAAEIGLPHWSCVSPKSNEVWVRRDGELHIAKFNMTEGYPAELTKIDIAFPLGSDWANFELSPRPAPEPSKDLPSIPQLQHAKAEHSGNLKEAAEWIIASVLLFAVLLLSAITVLNDMEETLTKPMPILQGDG
jgi:hypothetical protein